MSLNEMFAGKWQKCLDTLVFRAIFHNVIILWDYLITAWYSADMRQSRTALCILDGKIRLRDTRGCLEILSIDSTLESRASRVYLANKSD